MSGEGLLDLKTILRKDLRVAIVGVGSELRGDDVAGLALVRRIRGELDDPNVLLVEGGTVPENFTSKIKRFKPSLVIFVDAADFGGEPGDMILADRESIVGSSISTHSLPLSLLAEYLEKETGAKPYLLGIQPSATERVEGMSPEVEEAVETLGRELVSALKRS